MSVDALSGPHWVYRMFDENGSLLYVGMTADFQQRLKSWKSTAIRTADPHWFWDVCRITSDRFPERELAATAERLAIQTEAPLHNVRMVLPRDDLTPRGVVRSARADHMVRAYVDGDLTLSQIGRCHGVTRERVRQVITKHDPTLYYLAKRRRQARSRLRAAS